MIKGLRGATTWSEDLNNLLPFYRDLLGLPIAIQIPGFVVLGKLGAATLALGTHSEVRGRNADPARHMVALETDGLRRAHGRADRAEEKRCAGEGHRGHSLAVGSGGFRRVFAVRRRPLGKRGSRPARDEPDTHPADGLPDHRR